MDIYSNPETANLILTLENDRKFCERMEEYASQIASSFFKLEYTNAAQIKKVVKFSYASFLSYSTQEVYSARVSDLVDGAIKRLQIEPTPYEAEEAVKTALKEYYYKEIMLGNLYQSYKESMILTEFYIGKKSKTSIAKDQGITVYMLNKVLEKWPEDAYNRFLKVNKGVAYSKVMGEAENATQPHKTLYQLTGKD